MKSTIGRMAVAAGAVAVALAVSAADVSAKEATHKKATKEKKSGSGYIGVYMQELTDEVRKGLDLEVSKGVLISGVQDDSPAEKAGLEEGDVVTSFAGKDVDSPDELRSIVSDFEPGVEAELELVRDGKAQKVTLTVGDRPERETFSFVTPDLDGQGLGEMRRAFAMIGGPRLGIDARDIKDDELGSYFGAKTGILVLDVSDESVAEKAGVKAGDVIQKIGDESVADIDDLRQAVREFDEGDEFTIGVLRHGKAQLLKAVMDEQEFSFHNGQAPMWREFHHGQRAPRAPRMHVDRESLREEIDELKRELREMKEQLEREDS